MSLKIAGTCMLVGQHFIPIIILCLSAISATFLILADIFQGRPDFTTYHFVLFFIIMPITLGFHIFASIMLYRDYRYMTHIFILATVYVVCVGIWYM